MRGITRLIEGLQSGDPAAVNVLAFAFVGTAVILLVTSFIRRKRRSG